MSLSEFDLIRQFFAEATASRDDVRLGVGDDCALLQVPDNAVLAVSMDTLVEGRHFFADCAPEALGHKALAVNLSDLAAMGAEPAWVTLSLTLPGADPVWLETFMRGFGRLAAAHRVQLVGGDTTRGPLSITVQAHGFLPDGKALRRDAGRSGDLLFVSGTVGDAGFALRHHSRPVADSPYSEELADRLDRPVPRVALGRLLLDHATAAIDISDGLVADLRHICEVSGVGARIDLGSLPLSAPVAAVCAQGDWDLPLAAGDDYELLFAVPPHARNAMLDACHDAGHTIHEIGRLVPGTGVTLIHPDGRATQEVPDGFDHFRN